MITLDSPISILGLSTRPARALWCDNIETIGQLVELAPHELLRIPGLGRLSLNEIEMNLALYGFALRDPDKDRPIPKTKGKWQPIETAPKDQPVFIKKLHQVGIAIYNPAIFGEWQLCSSVSYLEEATLANMTNEALPLPTHWMPLPEGPQ